MNTTEPTLDTTLPMVVSGWRFFRFRNVDPVEDGGVYAYWMWRDGRVEIELDDTTAYLKPVYQTDTHAR